MTTQYNWSQPESFESWAREPQSRRSLLDGAFLVAPIIEPTIDLRAWSIVTRGILRKCIANVPAEATPVERFHEANKSRSRGRRKVLHDQVIERFTIKGLPRDQLDGGHTCTAFAIGERHAVRTDGDGVFVLENLPPGARTIKAQWRPKRRRAPPRC